MLSALGSCRAGTFDREICYLFFYLLLGEQTSSQNGQTEAGGKAEVARRGRVGR